jgi:acetyl esterase/lipase
MTYHKTSFFFLIIVIIIFVLIGYTKGMVIYHPMPATKEKYHRFYKKINQLIDSPDQVTYLSIPTPDNEILDGIYVKKPDSDKCIIIFHGNTGNLSIRFDMVKFLYNYCSVIIFDYRSFGRSTGNPKKLSCTTMQKDAQSVWNHVVEKLSIKPNDISLLGESLGCSIAIKLAADLSMTHDPTKYPRQWLKQFLISTELDFWEKSFPILLEMNINQMNG